MSQIIEKNIVIGMSNGEKWSVPVMIIANNRAKYYSKILDMDFKKSLSEDTIPLFNSDDNEIIDW